MEVRKMFDLSLQAYTDWYVKPVMRIKKGYGYRVILKYQDGSEKEQQKSGFRTEREAKKARDATIGELYSGNYIVYTDVKVSDFMEFWLEEDIKKRVGSYGTYYSFSSIVKNHVNPALGEKKMAAVNRGDVQKLYKTTAEYSESVARSLKTVMNVSFRFAVSKKVVTANPAEGVKLPKKVKKKAFHTRKIDTQKTLTLEQVDLLLEKSKDTPIHMQVLFNVLMGLRCSEIIAVKYSDIDYINRTLKVERQLGRPLTGNKEDFAPKTWTKQEVKPKTSSSTRELPIPDYVFEAILQERELYEKHKNRRKREFQDLGYICCSAYGRPRSRNYHWSHYKKLLTENGLPDIRWHDLRSTYCTLLLKNNHNPKAVSKLMGHAKEIITIDVYGDNKEMTAERIPELEAFMEEVIPKQEEQVRFREDLLDIEIDVREYLPAS
jgi:integrase